MKRGFAALRLEKEFKFPDLLGQEVKIALHNEEQKVCGVLPVFATKTAARKIYGRKVELLPVEWDEESTQ